MTTNTIKLIDKETKGNVEVSLFEHDSKLNKWPSYEVTCTIAGVKQPRTGGGWSLAKAREDMYSIFAQYTK